MATSSPAPTLAPPGLIAQIQPQILDILRHADLSSISAKRVRAQLAQRSDLPPGIDLVAHKRDIDELVKQCFDLVSNDEPAAPAPALAPTPPVKRESAPMPTPSGSTSTSSNGIQLPGLGGIPGSHSSPAPSSQKRKIGDVKSEVKADEDADARLAAALASEWARDATPTRTTRGGGTNGSSASAAKKKKKKVSAAVIDSDEEGAPAKKKRATNPNNPFNRPVILDAGLAEICGGDEMPRHTIIKKLWEYIKGNSLQNEANKRQILCDAKLQALFGKKMVDSFEMAKLIGAHVSKKEDLAAS